jgi:L-iditol 2-dehydrogenase
MVNLFASLPSGASQLVIDSRLIHYRELFVSGASDSTSYHVEQAVKLLEKGFISEKIITHHFPLSKFMDALHLMERRECLKILIHPE